MDASTEATSGLACRGAMTAACSKNAKNCGITGGSEGSYCLRLVASQGVVVGGCACTGDQATYAPLELFSKLPLSSLVAFSRNPM